MNHNSVLWTEIIHPSEAWLPGKKFLAATTSSGDTSCNIEDLDEACTVLHTSASSINALFNLNSDNVIGGPDLTDGLRLAASKTLTVRPTCVVTRIGIMMSTRLI